MTAASRRGRSALLPFDSPVQIAFAVPDAHAGAVEWAAKFGAGPFFLRRHIVLSDVVYRGQPASFDHTSAYGQWGAVMVELVEDHTVGSSVVNERAPGNVVTSPFLHHVAHIVEDFDAVLNDAPLAGFEIALSARASNTPFAFLDTWDAFGHFVELYPATASLRSFYAMVAAAAQGWDGQDPVRLVGQ